MEHFISINYSGSVDEKYLAECLASSSQILNEDALEFYTGKVGNTKTIRMPLPEAIENVEETAQELAMRLFEFGLKKFEIELTEATLRRGSRGEAVRKLQLDLGVQPADGVFGPATEAAVKDFQQRMMPGETADGIVGPKTNTAIQQSAAIDTGDNPEIEKSDPNSEFAALSGFATSRRGGIANNPSQVDAIKELQAELKRRGLLDGAIDGKYGPQTRAAVRAFQEQNNLYVDGDAGPKTIQALMQREDPNITMTPLDEPQDRAADGGRLSGADQIDVDNNQDDELIRDLNPNYGLDQANPGRIQGDVPPDVASQITQMNQDRDFAGILELVNKYEKLYVSFNSKPMKDNPNETVYAFLQRMANQGTTQGTTAAVGDAATQQQSDTLKDLNSRDYPMPGEPLSQGDVDALSGFSNESAGPRPKGAFMFRERNEWISKYSATHNIDGSRKRQIISEGLESLEETFEDDDKFFETYGIMWYNEDEVLDEAEYQGRKVKLGKPMAGDTKKFKVYVKNPKGNVVKVNFGQKGARIKKDNAARRRSFRARHNCSNPGPRHKARYWSCRKW